MAGQTAVERMMWRRIWICSVGVGALSLAVPTQAAHWHQYLTTAPVVASIDHTSLHSNCAGHKTFLTRTVLRCGECCAHETHYRPGTVILSCQKIDCHHQHIRLVGCVVRDPGGVTLDTDTAVGAH